MRAGRRHGRPLHLGQPRQPEGRRPHPRRRRCGPPAAGLEARCIGPGERLYIPMPFFWTGGFGGGLLSALVAGATLSPRRSPSPARTLELLRARAGHAVPRLARPGGPARGQPGVRDRRPVVAAATAASPAVLPADRRPAPGARPNLFGMTETFGPYCGDRLDLDMPRAKCGSCGRPFAGVEVRIADPETGAALPPGELGEIRLRGPNLMRGICGQLRAVVFTADGFYPTGDLGRLDADGYLWYARPARRHVQGEGRDRVPVGGRGRAARARHASPRRSSST